MKEPQQDQAEKKGILLRLVGFWLRLTGPRREQTEFSSIEDQERWRHSRLLSAVLFCGIIAILLAIPTAVPVPTYWIPIVLNLSLSFISLVLNRRGKITSAGVLYILAIDVTLVVLLVTLPTGIRNSNIPDFDLFFLPVLISGAILPKRFIPFIAAMHIALIITLFGFLPHDTLLTQEIQVNQGGFAYSELSDAFIIQVIGAAIAWLSAWSVDRALLRASRAEDLAQARQYLHEQSLQIVEQKQRLEYGIGVVKDAQARFANGDFKARARLHDNELLPLALSFNLLAERLTRITQVAQDYTRLEKALQRLVDMQHKLFSGGRVKPYQPSGTLVDRIQPIVQRYYQLGNLVIQSRPILETLGKDLTQQQTLMTELNAILSQSSLLQTSAFADALVQLSQANNSPQLSAYISSQTELMEKAQRICRQLDRQNKQSAQETKRLVAQLPGTLQLFNIVPGTVNQDEPRAEKLGK